MDTPNPISYEIPGLVDQLPQELPQGCNWPYGLASAYWLGVYRAKAYHLHEKVQTTSDSELKAIYQNARDQAVSSAEENLNQLLKDIGVPNV